MGNYNKEELNDIIKESYSLSEVIKKLKLSPIGSWNRNIVLSYIRDYELDISHFKKIGNITNFKKKEMKDILVENSTYANTSSLKERLYDEGYKERICELCGQDENWMGKKISLILDHKNGINNDNRIENLQIVCPNCNATLPTHCRGFNKLEKKRIRNLEKKGKERLIEKFISQRKVKRPSYDIIKIEIENLGYEGVGRKYGVTGNSIKKWLKTYEKYEV